MGKADNPQHSPVPPGYMPSRGCMRRGEHQNKREVVITMRPPKYKNAGEMQEKIDAYFKACEGEMLTNEDGTVMTDKFGRPIVIGARPPTVTGLALALGFTSRQALLNYQAKKAFVDTVTRAKARIEAYTEERLFDRDGVQGAKFSLQNNFRGWSERPAGQVSADVEDDPITQALKEEGHGIL